MTVDPIEAVRALLRPGIGDPDVDPQVHGSEHADLQADVALGLQSDSASARGRLPTPSWHRAYARARA
jgi:hypothetical protein